MGLGQVRTPKHLRRLRRHGRPPDPAAGAAAEDDLTKEMTHDLVMNLWLCLATGLLTRRSQSLRDRLGFLLDVVLCPADVVDNEYADIIFAEPLPSDLFFTYSALTLS